jgi:hypothetical protein
MKPAALAVSSQPATNYYASALTTASPVPSPPRARHSPQKSISTFPASVAQAPAPFYRPRPLYYSSEEEDDAEADDDTYAVSREEEWSVEDESAVFVPSPYRLQLSQPSAAAYGEEGEESDDELASPFVTPLTARGGSAHPQSQPQPQPSFTATPSVRPSPPRNHKPPTSSPRLRTSSLSSDLKSAGLYYTAAPPLAPPSDAGDAQRWYRAAGFSTAAAAALAATSHAQRSTASHAPYTSFVAPPPVPPLFPASHHMSAAAPPSIVPPLQWPQSLAHYAPPYLPPPERWLAPAPLTSAAGFEPAPRASATPSSKAHAAAVQNERVKLFR